MSALEFRPAQECRYDLVALGEVMLRLDPGNGRVATTRNFSVSEGGGEYNVARGLKRCFGLRTGLVTALADNPVGHLIEDLIYQGGVEQAHLDWREYDGIGRAVRNPLNFTERGIGVRGALGCSDRGHSAASQMKPGDVEQVQGLRELLDRLGPHPDVEALVASDLEFHRRISAYSGNSALCSLLDSLSGPATRARLVL